MFGVVDGLYYCNLERTEELNDRLLSRNVPSEPLRPTLFPRAQQTKFTVLGKEQPERKETCPPINRYPNYSPSKIFNPGNAEGPWYGYASNINDESSLRNQFFALQADGDGSYIPSSDSDLYQNTIVSKQIAQPFPNLFKKEEFSPFHPNSCGVAKQLFHNHTQQQIKDL